MSREDFLQRWSRRKHAARHGEPPPDAPAGRPDSALPEAAPGKPGPPPAAATDPVPPEPLPPVESLTPESDFAPFMRSDVDPGTRRQALKALFSDPRFNVMDGLDTYIDDFSKPDPIPADWLGKMNQLAHLGDYRARAPAEGPGPSPDRAEPRPTAAEIPASTQGTSERPDDPKSDTSDAGRDPPESTQSGTG